MRTKKLLSLFAVIALMMLGTSSYAGDQPAAVYGSGANHFSLATGSPGELGLLKVLAEAFGNQDNAKMTWFKAGSGKSLQLLKDKKVDMIMVHAQQQRRRRWRTVGPSSEPSSAPTRLYRGSGR